ncbi:MAG: DUF2179 domain-containing protein [Calditrichaeota bacterium]|nr:DUF2179 domain-containing protein [Calditrichota bacterium]MCB0304899.1 DUF2179 domain-containing protein [Calditrichota bacterium]MCB9087105.1 DUF2179 domain-containing protein [Calditrichia bacterium]
MHFGEFDLFTWVILPLMIFCARIIDVSIGTIRIVFISRGNKLVAPILGFFEVLIWLIAVSQILQNLHNAACYVAFAGGFATGNYVGMVIEQKLAFGLQVVRVIVRNNADKLVERLKRDGYGVTHVDGQGSTGPVKVIFTLIQRKKLAAVQAIIHRYHPKAFYTVEDVQMASEAILPLAAPATSRMYWQMFKMDRKRK